MTFDPFMTVVPTLGEYLDKSPRSAWRFVKDSGIPVYREGRKARVKKSDVDAWMNARIFTPKLAAESEPATLKDLLASVSEEVLSDQ